MRLEGKRKLVLGLWSAETIMGILMMAVGVSGRAGQISGFSIGMGAAFTVLGIAGFMLSRRRLMTMAAKAAR